MKIKAIIHETEEGETLEEPPKKHPRSHQRLPARKLPRQLHPQKSQSPRNSRVKTISGKRFCLLLQAQGCRLERINGSHHIFAKKARRKPSPFPSTAAKI